MSYPLAIVDAFTAVPFRGNPAAVCVLPEEAETRWMQSVAEEMNLSETAFLWQLEASERSRWGLRWFTPRVEVDLCGHATLASAHVLWTREMAPVEPIVFTTRSGELSARRDTDWIELDFPRRDPIGVEPPEALIESLGVMPSFVGRSGESDYLIVVDDECTVRSLQPDMALLREVPARGVIVTAEGATRDDVDGEKASADTGEPAWDFVSRFFAPAVGVDEDPVTGSAHCTLGPYWSRRLKRDRMIAYQASQRGGLVRVRVDLERVRLGGQAITVVDGALTA